jgi:hypothetical protein
MTRADGTFGKGSPASDRESPTDSPTPNRSGTGPGRPVRNHRANPKSDRQASESFVVPDSQLFRVTVMHLTMHFTMPGLSITR